MKAKITFTEPVLGTTPGDKELAHAWVISKGGDKLDEIMTAEQMNDLLEKACTVFPRDGDKPFWWDYQWKGFFKEACKAMIDMQKMTQEELKKYNLTNYSYKRTIDNLIFVYPRKIFINMSGPMTWCERPLRAQTMQGERICLARSEEVPAGSTCEIEVEVMNDKLQPFIEQWLTYGAKKGTGQWRNSGKGRFTFEKLD